MRMPWEEDIDWGNTATTIVKGDVIKMLQGIFEEQRELTDEEMQAYKDMLCRKENDMGVYVPNIKKPKHCTECYFVSRDQCELQDNSYDYDTFKEQKKHCPLIEIDLVRCGECKWYDKDFKDCNIRDSYGWEYMPTDFCSYGERRADNERL